MKWFKKTAVAAGVILFWLAIWQIIALAVDQELQVPQVPATARALLAQLWTGTFWTAVAMSLLRVASGFTAGLMAGMALAALTVRHRTMRMLLAPPLRVIRAAPVASFIILALVWLPKPTLPAFIAFLMVTPLVWEQTEQGIRATDRQLLEMALVFRFGRRKRLRHIWLPSLKPSLSASCANGIGFAWKSSIAAEIICHPAASIGGALYSAKIYLETPEVFAYTAVVAVLSMLLEWGIKKVVRHDYS